MPVITWGQEFVFAEQGQAILPIIIARDANETTLFAAEELAKYLKQISGAEFQIERGLGKEGIVLVNLSSTNEIVDCPEAPDLKPDGYCMLPRQDGLFLFGSNSRALLYAVYHLLERCGCCWLSPDFQFYNRRHEIVPQKDRIEVSIRSVILEGPDMKYRKLYVEEGLSHTTENLLRMIDWMPKRRFNTLVVPLNYAGHDRVLWDNWREELTPELIKRDIWIEVGGHGYENFLNAEMEDGTLFDKHPEWFGMNEQGEREKSKNRVFCFSNKHAFQYLLKNLSVYLHEHSEIEIFDFWPPDGAKWCQCEECKKQGHPQERHAKIVSKASFEIKKVRPDVKFECIAYSSHIAPPATVFLDSDILIDFCPIAQCFDYQIYEVNSQQNSDYRDHLEQWCSRFEGEVSVYSYYRKYAWKSLPVLLPNYMQKDLRYYREIEVDGISSYAEPGDWATYELNHYLLGELAWNCDTDVDSVVDGFAAARFGDSADVAKKAYLTFQSMARTCSSIPHQVPKTAEQYQSVYQALCELCQELQEEISSVNGETQKALKRLSLSAEYLSRDVHLKYLQSADEDTFTRRKREVQDLYNFINKNKNAGVFLTERMSSQSLAHRYGLTSD